MAESLVQVTEGSGKKMHTWSRTVGANTVEDEYVQVGEFGLATYGLRTAGVSTATLDSHLLQIMAGASNVVYVRWVKVYQYVVATTATFALFDVVRLTTAGTGGTTVSLFPRDINDSTAGATAQSLPTVKGTEAGIHDGAVGYMTQTPGAGGMPQITLVADFDYTHLRGKGARIASGVANGLCVKNRTAVAGGQVIVVAEVVEASF